MLLAIVTVKVYSDHSRVNTSISNVIFICIGFLSQNVLACCHFNLMFAYILPGWEGSTADARLWANARESTLLVPLLKYYLGDAGFPSCFALLVPYRGVRYHLKE